MKELKVYKANRKSWYSKILEDTPQFNYCTIITLGIWSNYSYS
jgi:hypothetical protein